MDLRQLNSFIAVAEERHFGRAAQRLHMAQPALSQQIRQLEQQVGVKLFDRTTRRVDLTAAGELLLHRGRLVVNEVEALKADVFQVGVGATGVLRVGFSGSATYSVMPQMVRAAAVAHPGLSLDLHGEMLTPDMESSLLQRSLDAAILRPPVVSQEIEYRIIRREPLMVAVAAHSQLAEDPPVAMSELADQMFVTYPPGSVVYRETVELCRRAGVDHRVAHIAQGTTTVLSLVAAGSGVAVVPSGARAVQWQGVRYRQLQDAPIVELAIAWRREERSQLLANFITLITTEDFEK